MKYFSTRGGDQKLSFEEVNLYFDTIYSILIEISQTVLTGLAPNAGLYIPESIPSLPSNWKTDWRTYSFIDLSVAILSLYISQDEISTEELRSLVEKSYKTFRHPDVTPLKKLNDKTFLLELFHGPTFAFKDVALQLLGNLFEFFLFRRNARKTPGEKLEKLTVVGATSGDTGRCVEIHLLASFCTMLMVEKVLRFTASATKPISPSLFFTLKVVFRRSKRHK